MKKLLFLLLLFIPFAVGGQVIRASGAYNKVQSAGGGGESTLLDGLVSYWDLDEASGDALDAVDANDGTVDVGVTQGETGILGDCYLFSGSNYEMVLVGNTPANLQLSVFTVSCWVNIAAINSGTYGLITSYGGDGGGFQLTEEVGEAKIKIGDSDAHYAEKKDGAIEDGAWHHLAATFDGTNLYLYIDGDVQGAAATFAYSITYTGNEFQIGSQGYVNVLLGNLDEIAVYNRAMAESGIDSLYNSGTGITYPFE